VRQSDTAAADISSNRSASQPAGARGESSDTAGAAEAQSESDSEDDTIPGSTAAAPVTSQQQTRKSSRSRVPSTKYPSTEYAANAVDDEVSGSQTVKEALEGPATPRVVRGNLPRIGINQRQ